MSFCSSSGIMFRRVPLVISIDRSPSAASKSSCAVCLPFLVCKDLSSASFAIRIGVPSFSACTSLSLASIFLSMSLSITIGLGASTTGFFFFIASLASSKPLFSPISSLSLLISAVRSGVLPSRISLSRSRPRCFAISAMSTASATGAAGLALNLSMFDSLTNPLPLTSARTNLFLPTVVIM